MLFLGFLPQLLHQDLSTLRLLLDRLHAFGEEALEKIDIALLKGRQTLGSRLMCLEDSTSLGEEVSSKLCGALLGNNELFCNGLVGLKDFHSLF